MSHTSQKHYYVFTDGACSKNGKPGARASFAAIIGTGDEIIRNACESVSGLVADQAYALVDPAAPEKSYAVAGDGFVAASNNRGELLGIISALLMIINHAQTPAAGAPAETLYEIVSDSRISIMTLLEWLPNRRATNTTHKLKNMDLLSIAEALLARARGLDAHTRVELVHVHSHCKPPVASAPERDWLLWRGNATVDSLATAALV